MTSFGDYAPYGESNRDEDNGNYSCRVINGSAAGLRLKWGNADKAKIRIGELVATQHPAKTGDMPGIGVIHRLKSMDRTAEHDYYKGLYIPAFTTTHQPAGLILPAYLYHVNDVVALLMNEKEHNLRLVKVAETTPGYSRFHFIPLIIPQEQQY